MKYVILGSSAAGMNAARELRRLDQDGEILVVSGDRQIYSRCILHHYLGNKRSIEQLNFVEYDFFDRYRVEWKPGTKAAGLDIRNKRVVTDQNEAISYDKLLIATGAHASFPPVKHMEEAANIAGFRNLEDAAAIKEAVINKKHVVVMGAGLVGMDCICGLLDMGVVPCVVEMGEHLLVKQLDARAAAVYQDELCKRGVKQHYGVGAAEIVLDETRESKEVKQLILTDGTVIPCDFLVVAAGVKPNVDFLQGSGVSLSSCGLEFDQFGRTNVPDIYGAGDVSGKAPIWPAAVKEGIIAAGNMAGVSRKMTDFFASKATMNFLGIPSMSLGQAEPEDTSFCVEQEWRDGNYKKIIHKGGRITGALLQGDLSYAGILQQLISHRIDVSKVKKPIFEIDYSDFFHVDDNFEYYYEEDGKWNA